MAGGARRGGPPFAVWFVVDSIFRVITYESLSVDTQEPGVVRVRYVQLDGGIDMGGTLVFDRANLAYFAAELAACGEHDYERTERQCGRDHVRIYQSGSDQQSFVNVLCRQEGGGLSGLILTIPYAMGLAGLLRGLELH